MPHSLIAIRNLRYDGKSYKAGDAFDARNSQHATLLTATRQARAADAPVAAPRETYQTADLTADPGSPADDDDTDGTREATADLSGGEPAAGEPTAGDAAKKPGRSRTYKRRDLRARE